MAFDKETGSKAGKKSKRGSSKEINELSSLYADIIHIPVIVMGDIIIFSIFNL